MRAKHVVAACALAGSAITPILAADPSRPRGVGPQFAKYYKATDTFTCINNPNVKVHVSRINDDVCDCPDGSDEPGTSACSYISPLSPPSTANYIDGQTNNSLALPGFYCKNKGHQPIYIPFSYVNDGVCDYDLCCDGSDEWEGVGGVKCDDKCKEIGKEWRKQDTARKVALSNAAKARKELVAEASRLKKECEDRVVDLKTEIHGAELRVTQLEQELVDVERQEKAKIVHAPKEGGKMSVLIGLAKQRTEELRAALERVKGERDNSQARLKRLEGLLATFKEEYNPNFNDEGVKRAVRAWEDYVAEGTAPDFDGAQERDLTDALKLDADNGVNWDEWVETESESDVLYKIEEYLPKSLRDWVDKKLRELRVMLIENGIIAGPPDSGESRAVTDARNRLNTARNELTTAKTSLQTHQDDLVKDYGPDDVFRAMKDKCVLQDSGEYTYELCWMGRTTQKPKKGGSNTGMGNFVRFDTVVVDEEVPADGKGLGSGTRITMKFENGQHCWNGPSRSTTVIMACAEKDEIWKIAEEEKCVYRMEVGTPAVCESDNGKQGPAQPRDEL